MPIISYKEVRRQLEEQYQGRIAYKRESFWMKVIDWFLRIVSFGQMTKFMTNYVTTIGTTVYVTDSWAEDVDHAITLRHEMVHMKQRERYGFFWFAVLYLFVPLPIGLAYFRAKFEKEAYEETLLGIAQVYGIEALNQRSVRDRITGQFLGSSYLWMWPFRKSIVTWYADAAQRVRWTLQK